MMRWLAIALIAFGACELIWVEQLELRRPR